MNVKVSENVWKSSLELEIRHFSPGSVKPTERTLDSSSLDCHLSDILIDEADKDSFPDHKTRGVSESTEF